MRSSITLSPKEEEIFATLLGTVAMFELKTVLRVAGGWVRDKVSVQDSTLTPYSTLVHLYKVLHSYKVSVGGFASRLLALRTIILCTFGTTTYKRITALLRTAWKKGGLGWATRRV